MAHRILIIDDEPNIRRMLAALLRAEGFTVEEAGSGNAGLLTLDQLEPDAIFLDLLMPPGPDGLETLTQVRARGIDVPVIMMSGKAQLADAVRATQLGAFQFLEKPLSPEAVLVTLRSAVELGRTRHQNRALREALEAREQMVGESAALGQVRRLIEQVAPTDARVLITGESGTGKELVAAAIHRASRRATEPFVTVNCAAIPRELVESEMFGHERGAFTGATERRLGRFELADGGTLFLDEVGDLNLEAQAKLLRTLETGVLQRLGAEQPTLVNVRVLAATNRRLDQAVAAGQFREDLFFRLNIFPIHLPPLRERLEDLPALVQHLARRARPGRPQQYAGEALALLRQHHWPGNIRELANVVERLAIIGGEALGSPEVAAILPGAGKRAEGPAPRHAGEGAPVPATGLPLTDALDDYERSLIAGALEQAGGNVAEAARVLVTDRANLYRRMKRLGLTARAEPVVEDR
ncbi:MAG: sigma-54-dependent Fis family transcriptional regulator [Gemmatimonadetes bacterium]|nr:sigma-54-dependent Fis family transcriptional regulator [Gemmatimonadota bacterium]MBK9692572.1 sigma-54-dependent Fis family transcriptional regulator [Gemmatimonadota bacterium]